AEQETPAIQTSAARSVGDVGDTDLARKLLERWQSFRINIRRELIGALVRSARLASLLVEALEAGTIAITELDLSAREALRRIPDSDLQTRAAKILASNQDTDRDAVVKKYQPALELQGDAKSGAALFARHCLTCHQFQGKGARVGPELSGIGSR